MCDVLNVLKSFTFTATITTCWVYLINDGITVNEHSVIVEWSGTGALNYLSDTFTYLCKVDKEDPQPCTLTFPSANEAGYVTDNSMQCNVAIKGSTTNSVIEYLVVVVSLLEKSETILHDMSILPTCGFEHNLATITPLCSIM